MKPHLRPPDKAIEDLQRCVRERQCEDCRRFLLKLWIIDLAAELAIREGPELDCE